MLKFQDFKFEQLTVHQLVSKKYFNRYFEIKYICPLEELSYITYKIIEYLVKAKFNHALTNPTLKFNAQNAEIEVGKIGNILLLSFFYIETERSNLLDLIRYAADMVKKSLNDIINYDTNDLSQEIKKIINESWSKEDFISYKLHAQFDCIDEIQKIADLEYINNIKNIILSILDFSEIHLYYIGREQLNKEEIVNNLVKVFNSNNLADNYSKYLEERIVENNDIKIERYSANLQNTLVIGILTNSNIAKPNFPVLLLYNALLGQFPNSKLYQTVRVKQRLAYDIKSHVEYTTGLVVIESRTNIEYLEKIRDLSLGEIKRIKIGHFSNEELGCLKKMLNTYILFGLDSPKTLIKFHFYMYIFNQRYNNIEELITSINNVSKQDIVDFSKDIRVYSTIYIYNQNELQKYMGVNL